MKYYKQLNEIGEIIALFTYDFEPKITNTNIVEIMFEEYQAIINQRKQLAREQAEIKKIEQHTRIRDLILKAKAYDVLVGKQ